MPAKPIFPMPARLCAASRIIGNIRLYSASALSWEVPHPWLKANRSVMPAAAVSSRKSPWAGAVSLPFWSHCRSHTGSPVGSCRMTIAFLSDVRKHPHQVDQAGALCEWFPAQVGGALREHGFDLLWPTDESRLGGQERGDDAADVRRRHRRAG